jgi:hypothetical protein
MNKEILQKIYENELELYSFIDDVVETFDTEVDQERLCNFIWYMRFDFREQKERSGKTLYLIRERLYGDGLN